MDSSPEHAGPPDKRSPPKMAPLTVDPALQRVPTGSSVLDEGAIEEHGRTYHHYKADSYVLPNDGEEQNRLDLQHHVAKLLMDGHLCWAPIQNPRTALDVGTGTGIWAIEFAKEHPDCQVVATDLSAIQPKDVVSNVEFVREDAEDDWTFGKFEFIHARFFSSFVLDFKAILKKAYDHLEPGGWIELQETALCAETIWGGQNDSAFAAILTTLVKVMAQSGKDPYALFNLRALLTQAGFVDVEEHVQPHPVGSWPDDPKYKNVGRWNGINALYAMESFIKVLLASGRSEDEAWALIRKAQAEIRQNSMFGFGSFHVVFGRKPGKPETPGKAADAS